MRLHSDICTPVHSLARVCPRDKPHCTCHQPSLGCRDTCHPRGHSRQSFDTCKDCRIQVHDTRWGSVDDSDCQSIQVCRSILLSKDDNWNIVKCLRASYDPMSVLQLCVVLMAGADQGALGAVQLLPLAHPLSTGLPFPAWLTSTGTGGDITPKENTTIFSCYQTKIYLPPCSHEQVDAQPGPQRPSSHSSWH